MKLLLDTHTLLWAVGDPSRLPLSVRQLIDDHRNEIVISVASIFEIASKRAARSRLVPDIPAQRMLELANAAGYRVLAFTAQHAVATESVAAFHGDPFDKLLLAQAAAEGLQLVTHDEALADYDPHAILF